MARPDNHNDCPNCKGCDCGIVPFTNAQQILLNRIIEHHKQAIKSGDLFGGTTYPKGSHMGMSLIKDFKTGKVIATGFQKRTWESLAYDRMVITQTLYAGYRLSDEFSLELYDFSKTRKEVQHGQ